MGSFLAPRARLLPLVLLLLSLLARVQGQVPTACPVSLTTRTPCCPVWSGDGSLCGSASSRGTCQQAPTSFTRGDERLGYPWGFYTHICMCTFPYAGHDCGKCTYNRWGSTCTTRYNVVRKDLGALSTLELNIFLNGLFLAKSTRSSWCSIFLQVGEASDPRFSMISASMYDCVAAAHAFNSKMLRSVDRDVIHRGPGFMPWHRWQLLELENVLQTVLRNYTFGLPYWDWRFEANTCTVCNAPYLGGSAFANWKTICEDSSTSDYCRMPVAESARDSFSREVGLEVDILPDFQDVSNCLAWTLVDRSPYDTTSTRCFRNCLEGFVSGFDGVTDDLNMHNQVHVFLGGDMLSTMIAPSDPIFFMHHGMVDSILETWMINNGATSATYPQNTVPGQGPNDYIVGSFPPVRNRDMFRALANFGGRYEYRAPMN